MEATSYLNASDALPNHVISDQDIPQRFNMTFIHELPFGRGRRLFSSPSSTVNAVIGGWQVQGIHVRQVGSALGFGNMLLYGTLQDIRFQAINARSTAGSTRACLSGRARRR